MLRVLFKGMEKMSKSEDGHATVGRTFVRGSQRRERRVPQHRLQDWMELEKASSGSGRSLSQQHHCQTSMSTWVWIPGSKSNMAACTCNPNHEETELVGSQGLLANQSVQIRELQAP